MERASYATLAAAVFTVALGTASPSGAPAQVSDDLQGISLSAASAITAILAEKETRTPTEQKIDSRLLYASRVATGFATADAFPRLLASIPAGPDGRVVVDVRTSVTPATLERFRALGGEVIAAVARYDEVRLRIGLRQVAAVAALPEVRYVMPKVAAVANQVQTRPRGTGQTTNVGSVFGEGDYTHGALNARTKYGVDGTGLRIGILSDNATHYADSQALNDLGVVTIVPGQLGDEDGSDEGTAMMEVVHDLAPGAQLFFATAFTSPGSMAQNIRDLRFVYNCDIIIDNIFWFSETPFHDGQTFMTPWNPSQIAQAVKDVTAAGAIYIASAGNSGNLNDGTSGTWEGMFNTGAAVAAPIPGAGTLHRFPGGLDYVTVTATAPISVATTLHWNDPLGASASDYDLFLLNAAGTAVVDFSVASQTGTQDPVEFMAAAQANERIVIVKRSGADRFLNLSTLGGRLSVSTAGEIHGHAATTAVGSFSVAATPAAAASAKCPGFAAGPSPGLFTSASKVECYSSNGPRRIYFNGDGTFAGTPGDYSAAGGIVLNKPDFTAADGVSVTGVGDFETALYGTSAAAAHAGAIAALVKSASPSLSAAQLRTALTSTAIDIEAAGWDRDSGAGIIMPSAAIASIIAPPAPPPGNVIVNGDFSTAFSGVGSGARSGGGSPTSAVDAPSGWKAFAFPTDGHMVSSLSGGVFNWKRIAQSPGQPPSQAAIFQETGVALGAGVPLITQFDAANTAVTFKTLKVLMVADATFTDLAACTFALPPGGQMRTYQMKGFTTKPWSNATLYFYASSPFAAAEAGTFQLDNVTFQHNAGGSVVETDCVDPTTPAPGVGGAGANMMTNGSFDTGVIDPWAPFGTLTVRTPMVNQVAEIIRPTNAHPAGALVQHVTPALPVDTRMTVSLQLGNSSQKRKRVLVIVSDGDFSSLAACIWWLPPGQPLKNYSMVFRNSEAWPDPTVGIYPSTIGPDQWIQVDNVVLQTTPAAVTPGTRCGSPAIPPSFVEPSGGSGSAAAAAASSEIAARTVARASSSTEPLLSSTELVSSTEPPVFRPAGADRSKDRPVRSQADSADGAVLEQADAIDLGTAASATLSFESWLSSSGSRGEVEASVDGVNWIVIGQAPVSDSWHAMEIGLSGFAGELVSIRFVLHGERWRVRDIDIFIVPR